MCHKYIDMDFNSAFLKLTNAMTFIKILFDDKTANGQKILYFNVQEPKYRNFLISN